MQTKVGDAIVDWLMAVAENPRLPLSVRWEARAKLRAAALRQPDERVEDVVGLIQ